MVGAIEWMADEFVQICFVHLLKTPKSNEKNSNVWFVKKASCSWKKRIVEMHVICWDKSDKKNKNREKNSLKHAKLLGYCYDKGVKSSEWIHRLSFFSRVELKKTKKSVANQSNSSRPNNSFESTIITYPPPPQHRIFSSTLFNYTD